MKIFFSCACPGNTPPHQKKKEKAVCLNQTEAKSRSYKLVGCKQSFGWFYFILSVEVVVYVGRGTGAHLMGSCRGINRVI